jgi:transposase
MGSRRQFSREFKTAAVREIVDRGVPATQVARDLDVHVTLINRWVRLSREDRQEAFPGHGKMKSTDAELAKLQRDLKRVTAERDILKKALGYFAKEST